MKKLAGFLVCFVVVVACSVFCFDFFKKHDISVLENKAKTDKQKIEMLSMAIKIVPANQKNEILYNSVKQKFPDLDKYPDIAKLIWPEVKIDESSLEKKEFSLKLTSAYDSTVLSEGSNQQNKNNKNNKK